jgi:ADP-ribose pyrophosphatase YjhB (NUDIX family)
MQLSIQDPTDHYAMPTYPMPFCRVEIAAQSLGDGRLRVLLVRRQEAPYKGYWALPGGVVRVDLDVDLGAAASRVAKERLGIAPPNLCQITTVGAKGRDPRGEGGWGLSVVYRALLAEDTSTFSPGKRVAELGWVPVDEIPTKIAFDHAELIAQAVHQTRSDIASLTFPPGFVPERFTLGELQLLCERVLGHAIDKASFRRKLRDRGLVEAIEGEQLRGGAHRPAAIFRLKPIRGSA